MLRTSARRRARPASLSSAAAARRPDALQDALRRAAGDPDLQLLLPRGGGWVDVDGLPVDTAPTADARRTPVPIQEQNGPLLGLLLIDAERSDEQALALIVTTCLRVLVARRLEHELRLARLDMEHSQARLLEAGDRAREHVRDVLEAGVLRRLRRARGQLSRIPVDPLLPEVRAQLGAASREISALAAGVHPALLQQGLGAAVRELAERAPQPVQVHDELQAPLSDACARVAWYVVAEALTNVAKHVPDASVTIWLRTQGEELVVRIHDDGRGGADPGGAGLRGLSGRVTAVGGTLLVDSSALPGVGVPGTCLQATLPLATVQTGRDERTAFATLTAPSPADAVPWWRWLPTVSLLPLLVWAWWTWPTQFDPFAPTSLGRTPGRALDVVFVLGVGAVGAYLSRVWAASRTGPLLAVYAWLCFLDDLDFAHGSWLGVLGQLTGSAGGVLFLLIVLAYPAAWVRHRAERRLVAFHVLVTVVLAGVGALLFLDTEDRLCGPECAPDGNPLNVVEGGADLFVRWVGPLAIGGQLLVAAIAIVLLWRRVRAATRRARAVLLPLVLPWSLALAVLVPLGLYDLVDILRRTVLGGGDWLPSVEGFARVVLAVNQVALGFVPVGYFIGMRRLLKRRRRLSELALPGSAGALEQSVRIVLDDPQARLVPGDEAPAGPGRTPLVAAGVRVGTLRHDPALTAEPGLLEVAAPLLALALAQDQLTERLAAELAHARASRERLLHEERQTKRRIERDLHDGAQQRLVAVQAVLGLLNGRQAQVAATEVAAAVSALRVLARGLAPPALELGLLPALTALGDRTRVPLRVTGDADGVPRSTADAAYDVLALLVDSAATASPVVVDVQVQQDELRLSVQPPLPLGQGVLDLLDAEGGRAEEREDALELVLPGRRILVYTP